MNRLADAMTPFATVMGTPQDRRRDRAIEAELRAQGLPLLPPLPSPAGFPQTQDDEQEAAA